MRYGFETAALDRYDLLKTHARNNRRNMTEAERVLWEALRKGIQGYKFRRQHPIADFIVDFVCISKKLIIEVDGGYHDADEQRTEDQLRTDVLQRLGFRVVRFQNEEVLSNPKEVISRLKEELNN